MTKHGIKDKLWQQKYHGQQ